MIHSKECQGSTFSKLKTKKRNYFIINMKADKHFQKKFTISLEINSVFEYYKYQTLVAFFLLSRMGIIRDGSHMILKW